MSEDDPYQPAGSTTDLEVIRESPIELPPNPAIGVLRFFVWLMPTAIVVGCFALIIWIDNNFSGSQFLSVSTVVLGFIACLLCGWFDAMIARPCRIGKRHRGLHAVLYVLTQALLVVPVLLSAIVYAICVSIPW